jgi:hypothetical protein
MKRITWNMGKNSKLKMERGVSFEMVMSCIARNAFKVAPTSSKSHVKQKAFFVWMNDKAWVVPFEESEKQIVLKTIMEDK